MANGRGDYGIDAPPVVRNLLLAGLASVGLGLAARLLAWPRPAGLLAMLLWPGVAWLATAAWMVLGSRVLKLRRRDQLLDGLQLRGDEQVLDVGCGRGLMLVGAARRLPRGQATGLDLWRSVDQSGNDPEVTRANAAAEGVAERVTITTGDMTRMPFAADSFDVIVSSWAIHNVPSAAGRAAALAEIGRVLRPGGRVVLLDIGPARSYGATLAAAGLLDVTTRLDSFVFFIPTWRISARKAEK